MLCWLVILHIFELQTLFAASSVTSLPELLSTGQCDAVYKVSLEAFSNSAAFAKPLIDHFNRGDSTCLKQVLDAYFKRILWPEWTATLTPSQYTGPLAKSAPIPDTIFPVSDSLKSRTSNTLDIAGQSKQPKSSPNYLTAHGSGKMVINIGEDAVGVLPNRDTFVVCDGVGGAEHSELVSFALSHLTLSIAMAMGTEWNLLSSSEKLISSLQSFLQKSRLSGSTTFLVAQVDRQLKQVSVLNVGDCQAMLIQDSTIVNLTHEQWYSPNAPYQMSTRSMFRASLADRYKWQYTEGMRLVLVSDGVGDNVWPRQVALVHGASQLLELARAQASGAIGTSIPFSAKMSRAFGGKMDDMSIIIVNL